MVAGRGVEPLLSDYEPELEPIQLTHDVEKWVTFTF